MTGEPIVYAMSAAQDWKQASDISASFAGAITAWLLLQSNLFRQITWLKMKDRLRWDSDTSETVSLIKIPSLNLLPAMF